MLPADAARRRRRIPASPSRKPGHPPINARRRSLRSAEPCDAESAARHGRTMDTAAEPRPRPLCGSSPAHPPPGEAGRPRKAGERAQALRTDESPGERIQIDAKVVPRSCIADPMRKLCQPAAIDAYACRRILGAYWEQSACSSAAFPRGAAAAFFAGAYKLNACRPITPLNAPTAFPAAGAILPRCLKSRPPFGHSATADPCPPAAPQRRS